MLKNSIAKLGIELAERELLPEWATRMGIRAIVKERLSEEVDNELTRYYALRELLNQEPLAVNTQEANEQHYEVPAEFFSYALGKHKKYSSCYYDSPTDTLDQAEAKMLALTCERAELRDGMQVLELGCGWGSLTLWMGEHYPNASITGVSNSNSQREYIMSQAEARGLKNISIVTADINAFATEKRFDRIVSVEMFEHLRNYGSLFEKISTWLADQGKLFVHIFCHREHAYLYETEGETNWMGRYFFTGGTMPSEHLFFSFQDHLLIERHWRVNGMHYSYTSEDWAKNMLTHREPIMKVLTATYGKDASRWFARWRLFFLACAELFGYRQGSEWYVCHYRFHKR